VLGVRKKLEKWILQHKIFWSVVLNLTMVQFMKISLMQEWLILPPARVRLRYILKVHRVIPSAMVNRRLVTWAVNLYQRKTLVVCFI